MAPPKKPLFEPDEVTAPLAASADEALPEGEVPGAPPEADVVASRALMVAVMLERARLETSGEVAALAKLTGLVEGHGLLGNLGVEGLALFEADPGAWTPDDLEAVRWTAEELHLLLWALGRVAPPSPDARADGAALVALLPLSGDVAAFFTGATLLPLEELEAQRVLWEAVLQAVESEVYARTLLEDPAQHAGDPEVEELLAAAAAEGFDRVAAAAQGPTQELVLGLRFWSRALLDSAFGDGSASGPQRLDAAQLLALGELELATLYGIAHTRLGACAWLVEGDHLEDEADAAP